MSDGTASPVVLGIESSCDETAAAIVTGDRTIRSNIIFSQFDDHRPFGGVVPEVAARAHVQNLDVIVQKAMGEAGFEFGDLDAVAATGGPGLIGGVLVGATMAKGISLAAERPFIAVNHLEGHALTARLTDNVEFPYLLLLVSGGHCQLLAVKGVGDYRRLGTTIDDAVGEAFDKTAKMLGLGYPGGPAVEKSARDGDPSRFALPRPLMGRSGCDFSFSGLKTAVRRKIEGLENLAPSDISDLAASFQAAVADSLADRCAHAIEVFQREQGSGHPFVVAGGVAANQTLRTTLRGLAEGQDMRFVAPPPALCTDNAAMIAWAGVERLRAGDVDALDFAPRPRWPLDPNAARAPGAGVKA
ncbi:MAG: tRNA (adenosine(37)-N6)-threonylcarbamoyltransferase complex transferase subunit TsaD [Alphaproteobacteria bacterium]|jgi:N6-L-threonylcarbamoyladenine synthase|nr:tRNA (adenosine(37)-N6)-threonylcarbamoyltransferase complex transferase subunit TsaD [Alphaproteobacteria bacterium]